MKDARAEGMRKALETSTLTALPWEYPLSHFHALSHGSLMLILFLANLLWLAVWVVAALVRRLLPV